MRTPQEIAKQAREELDNANKLFVPANIVRQAELAVEFMEAAAAQIQTEQDTQAALLDKIAELETKLGSA